MVLIAQVPWYGLVTTGNCKQIMLLLEDRHGDAGVDNQDLDLTLLRAAQVNAHSTLTQPCCQAAAHVFACDPHFSMCRSLTQRSLLCMFTASALHYTQQTCHRVLIHKSAPACVVNMFRCWMCMPEHNTGAAGVRMHSSMPSANSDWPCATHSHHSALQGTRALTLFNCAECMGGSKPDPMGASQKRPEP